MGDLRFWTSPRFLMGFKLKFRRETVTNIVYVGDLTTMGFKVLGRDLAPEGGFKQNQ